MAEFNRLDHSRDNFARTVLEFLKLAFPLSIADLLKDHLLGGLRIDAPQINRRQRINDEVTQLGFGIKLLGRSQIDLLEVILNFLNHFNHAPQP